MNVDQIFCANQIVIPPTLPSILKKYAKAAIRTQPYDLLVWSAAYFKAMATGATPPIKMRLEFPLPEHRKLSLGYMKLLVYQLGKDRTISREELMEKWNDVCLPPDILHNILRLGSFAHTIQWNYFIAIALGFLEESLKGTMMRICEVLTEEPEGGSAMIPYDLFMTLYKYLGEMDCGEVEVKEIPIEVVEESKDPCLPPTILDTDNVSSDKDIDSVIREVGEAESRASIETTLQGKGAELDWPNIESRSESDAGDLRFPSEASDVGATSKYGIEVMEPEPDAESYLEDDAEGEMPKEDGIGPIEEVEDPSKPLLVEEPVGGDVFVVEETQVGRVEEAPPEWEESALEEGEETAETESEEGSTKVLVAEREESSQESFRDSQISDTKRSIEKLDKEVLEKETSMVELRATVDRELRQKLIEQELEDQEEREKRRLEEEAVKLEKRRVEEEAKQKFHMHVPGIGPTLPEDLMKKAQEYLQCCAERQSNMVMPRNLRHFLCPPLDLQSEERIAGLESLLSKAEEQFATVTIGQKPKSSLIELVRSDDHISALSTMDTSMSDDSTVVLSGQPLTPQSTAGLAMGATSLLQLTLADK